MVLLHARLEAAGLDLSEVAELGLAPDRGAGAQVREGPDLDLVFHFRTLEDAGPDVAVAADDRVDDLAARPDPRPLADLRAAAQDDARLQDDVRRQLDGEIHVGTGRIDHRHAGQHVALVDGQPKLELGRGQLRPVVDAGERAVVLDFERNDRPPVFPGQDHQLGQIELARGRGALDVADAAAEPSRVEGVDAGVDLLDLQLVRRGILLLHDAEDLPAVIGPHDPSQAFGLPRVHRYQGDGRIAGPARVYQVGQQIGLDQRHVPREYENLADLLGDSLHGRADCVGRAERLVLKGEVGLRGEGLGQGRRRRRVDDQRPAAAYFARGVQDVREHRPSAQLVQDLGLAGLHARPEAGGHDHRENARRGLSHGIGR